MHKIAKNYKNSEKNGAVISIYRDLLLFEEFNNEALIEYRKLLEEILTPGKLLVSSVIS
jgi:hypothetical protein